MSNQKISQFPAGTFSSSIIFPAVDLSQPAGSQNVQLTGSQFEISNTTYPSFVEALPSTPQNPATVWSNGGVPTDPNATNGGGSSTVVYTGGYPTPTYADVEIYNALLSSGETISAVSISEILSSVSANSTLAVTLATQALPSVGGTVTGNLYLTGVNSLPVQGLYLAADGEVQPVTLSSRFTFNSSTGAEDLNTSGTGSLVVTASNGDPLTANAPLLWDSYGNAKSGSPVLSGTLSSGGGSPISAGSSALLGTVTITGATSSMVGVVTAQAYPGSSFGSPYVIIGTGGVVSVYLANISTSNAIPTVTNYHIRVLP